MEEQIVSQLQVAPFTGAWIETANSTAKARASGRALHGRVD